MSDPALHEGETFLRSDLVLEWTYHTQKRIATMLLTDRRVIFSRPQLPSWYQPLAFLVLPITRGRAVWLPIQGLEEFALTKVTQLHKWTPEFSLPPMIQQGPNFWGYFELIEKASVWPKKRSLDDRIQHFNDVEQAWDRARSIIQSDSQLLESADAIDA